MRTGKRIGILLTTLLVGTLAMPVLGQQAPGGNGGGGNGAQQGGGNGGGGRNFNPAQAQQRMMDRLKQQLGASDDEFAAIQPKLTKVMDLMRDTGGGMRGMFGGRRNRGNQDPNATPSTQPTSAVQQARQDLQAALDDQGSSADTIKDKLDAYRAARDKAKQDLVAAQQDLKSVLTQRQEAVLVMFGMLDEKQPMRRRNAGGLAGAGK